jgi:hypothetical protein
MTGPASSRARSAHPKNVSRQQAVVMVVNQDLVTKHRAAKEFYNIRFLAPTLSHGVSSVNIHREAQSLYGAKEHVIRPEVLIYTITTAFASTIFILRAIYQADKL